MKLPVPWQAPKGRGWRAPLRAPIVWIVGLVTLAFIAAAVTESMLPPGPAITPAPLHAPPAATPSPLP